MHRASNILNIGQGAITVIVTNRGCQNNCTKGHSRLLNLIRISLKVTNSQSNYRIQRQYKRWKCPRTLLLTFWCKLTIDKRQTRLIDGVFIYPSYLWELSYHKLQLQSKSSTDQSVCRYDRVYSTNSEHSVSATSLKKGVTLFRPIAPKQGFGKQLICF